MMRWALKPAFAFCAVVAVLAGRDAAADEVFVLSSYPEEMTAQFEKAFAQAHPEHRLRLVWQQGREALTTLSKPDHGGIDVYWAPALYNFPTLAHAGVFGAVKVDRTKVPGKIGQQPISDAQGRFEAFEVAGYGIAVNAEVLSKRGLSAPGTWDDLARPAFADLVSMPVPSKIGFAPNMYDIVLQHKGWAAGWALLSEMSANARLSENGQGIIGPVVDGDAAAALAIDFLVRTSIATGKPIKLIYPKGTAFLPAHVGIITGAPHPAAAQVFTDFVLSAEGQRLLFHPDVSRYPIRPDVYAAAPAGTVDPFALPADATFAYDMDIGPLRAPLISALFDAAITTHAKDVKALWLAIHAAETQPATKVKAAKARVLAGWVPVTAAQAMDRGFIGQFEGGRNGQAPAEVVAAWATQLEAKRVQARTLLGLPPQP